MTQVSATRGYAPTISVEEAPELVMNVGDKWDRSVMRINQSEEVVLRNMRDNIARQLPQLTFMEGQPSQHLAIVGGGWSLNDPKVFQELREVYFEGAKLVALNGAGNWLMERNMRPSLQFVLDSRPENIEFIREPIPNCRYLLASQCDPSLFELCKDRDTTIFHLWNGADETYPVHKVLDEYYNKRWTHVPTAGTVGIVAPMALRILGFSFFHLFGIDSCYAPDKVTHHAYPQALNDSEGSVPFESNGRVFNCSAWQASQAQTFIEMVGVYGDTMQFSVHGDGLIAHMLTEAARQEHNSSTHT
jgi:hypothetical protein